MNQKITAMLLAGILLTSTLSGCQNGKFGTDQTPVTLTLWHNYGGQMQKTMDTLVDEFNSTVGQEEGIVLNITSVSASKEQEKKLAAIANEDPGAPEMPDLVTAYPKTAARLLEKGLIAPLDSAFSKEELAAYVPQYIEEGRLADKKLYVLPVAKSTEVLFVNRTLFDRFSASTGVTLEALSSFEGIADAARKYHQWTDAATPDVPHDGKAFFAADSWLNIALVGTAQLGTPLAGPNGFRFDTPAYEKIWDFSVPGALSGSYPVYDGYSSDLAKTGDIVCSLGSTAGILFYGDTITYPDNRSEKVAYGILPYPTFEGGEKTALQRGAGMIVKKSDPDREAAAAVFLKWFTSPDINTRFVASTGYFPVTKQANEHNIPTETAALENGTIRELMSAAGTMYAEYRLIVAPNDTNFDTRGKEYENKIRQLMQTGRDKVLSGEDAEKQSRELFNVFRAQ